MNSWYRVSDDIELKDGTVRREYKLIFETTDKELAQEIEDYFKKVMDKE